ncbi:MAG: hypothetical protein H6732_12120 [Alphaproteobacteria bacterium]|nr:hypothetical protein [Alphaproteobacteria bacterium]
MRAWTVLLLGLLVASPALAGKKKKKGDEPAAPLVGWHQAEGATGACWHAPDFESLGIADRRQARSETLTAILAQWKGEREDGVAFDGRLVENVETVLLGLPEKIETIAPKNLELCTKAMAGGGTAAWDQWVQSLPRSLTKGECARPLDDTIFWYADLGMGWQGGTSICSDDKVKIWASAADEYRVDDNGPWINAAGDMSKPTAGLDGYLCTTEGCYAGQLLVRFRGQSGAEVIMPVGLELIYSPPEHGQIEFAINDTTYFNNVWRVVRGIQHRTAVTYEPLED